MNLPKWPFSTDEADPFQGDLWGITPHLYSGCTVLDIGANRGLVTSWCAINGACVTAYEPHPKAFQSLLEVIQLNRLQAQAFEAAISTHTGTTKLDMSTGPYFNSAQPSKTSLRNNDPEHNIFGVEVSCVSLADAIGTTVWDIVKMDIEGQEYPVLLTCPDSVFTQIRYLTVELHSVNDVITPERNQLISRLKHYFSIVEQDQTLFATKI